MRLVIVFKKTDQLINQLVWKKQFINFINEAKIYLSILFSINIGNEMEKLGFETHITHFGS